MCNPHIKIQNLVLISHLLFRQIKSKEITLVPICIDISHKMNNCKVVFDKVYMGKLVLFGHDRVKLHRSDTR